MSRRPGLGTDGSSTNTFATNHAHANMTSYLKNTGRVRPRAIASPSAIAQHAERKALGGLFAVGLICWACEHEMAAARTSGPIQLVLLAPA
jgi:hypothetical protein